MTSTISNNFTTTLHNSDTVTKVANDLFFKHKAEQESKKQVKKEFDLNYIPVKIPIQSPSTSGRLYFPVHRYYNSYVRRIISE